MAINDVQLDLLTQAIEKSMFLVQLDPSELTLAVKGVVLSQAERGASIYTHKCSKSVLLKLIIVCQTSQTELHIFCILVTETNLKRLPG